MCNTTQDNKSLYDRQEECIGVKADAFIGYLVKRGLLGDKNIDDEKIRTAKQEKRKNAYHNTLLLLKNYRTIAWMMECFPTAVAEELDRPFEGLDELLEQVDLEISLDNRKLQNRMAGMQKSRLLLDRVNDALTVLKKKPNDGERLYDIIYQTYISPEQLSLTDLLYRLDLSPRHYYRLREQAVTILSIRLWSSPGADVDFWLDLMTLMEGL